MNARDIEIINESSSLIENKSIQIAKTMYVMLFDLHPDFKVYFDNAPSNQHELLAETISVYAVNIRNIRILEPALQRISKVHTLVGVEPEQYPIIKKMLLLSIKVVLQEKATSELINAWDNAISFVANKLIAIEKELYAKEE